MICKGVNYYFTKVKKEPFLLIKEPYLNLLLPCFAVLFLRKRWNTTPDLVFLTESFIENHPLLSKDISIEYDLIKLITFEKAEIYLRQRLHEERLTNNYLKIVKKRFISGDYMLILSKNLIPLSFLFISGKRVVFTPVNFEESLPKKCFAIYDVYTFCEFRGKGLYKILIAKALQQMRSLNFSKFWLWVMKHNQISIKVHNDLKINHVIRVYSEYYRFGIRFFSVKKTDFYLSQLID